MENVTGINNMSSRRPGEYRHEAEKSGVPFSEFMGRMDIIKRDRNLSQTPLEGGSQLSPEAQSYLSDLKERFPNFHFEIKDFYTKDDVSRMAGTMTSEIGCIMNTALIEKMAVDEDFRREYEALLVKAEQDFNALRSVITDYENQTGNSFAWSFIVEEREGEFLYSIFEEGEELLSASSLEVLLEQVRDYMEKNRLQEDEQAEIYSDIVFNL